MNTRNNNTRKSNKRTKSMHKQKRIKTKTKRTHPKQKLTRKKHKSKILYGGYKFVVKIDNEPYVFDSADIFDGDKENIGQEEYTETIGDLKMFFKENEGLTDDYDIVIKNKTNRELLDDVIIKDILNTDKDYLILDKKRKVRDAIGDAIRHDKLKMQTGDMTDDRDDEFGALTTNMDSYELNATHQRIIHDQLGNTYDGIWNADGSGYGTIMYNNWSEPGKYEGQWDNGLRMRGQGILYKHDGDKYEGIWTPDTHGNGSGNGTITYIDGNIYRGSWGKDFDFIDNGIMTLKNGNSYDGVWNEDGSGTGIITYQSGTKKGGIYKGQWDYNTRMNGQGIYTIEGDKYEGTWTPEPNGNGAGYGIITYNNGHIYKGAWDRIGNPIQ